MLLAWLGYVPSQGNWRNLLLGEGLWSALPFSLLGVDKESIPSNLGSWRVLLWSSEKSESASVCLSSFLPSGFSDPPPTFCLSAAWGVCLCLCLYLVCVCGGRRSAAGS